MKRLSGAPQLLSFQHVYWNFIKKTQHDFISWFSRLLFESRQVFQIATSLSVRLEPGFVRSLWFSEVSFIFKRTWSQLVIYPVILHLKSTILKEACKNVITFFAMKFCKGTNILVKIWVFIEQILHLSLCTCIKNIELTPKYFSPDIGFW